MTKMRPVRGIVPVLVTPLSAEERIDIPALERLVEFLVGLDIGGLWVLGTGSEDMNLSWDKRLIVARTATEVNAGRVPLILGAAFYALEDIRRFMAETADLQADAYHVMPYHPLLGFDRIDWFYRHLADEAPKPMWMYTSANWSRPFPPEFAARLKGYPNLAGIKYSTRDAVNVFKVAGLADDDFQVITAVASQCFGCLGLGSRAHTSSLASALPEPLIRIHALFLAGRIEEAREVQRRLNDFLSRWPSRLKQNNFLQAAEEKAILRGRGVCREYVTSYYLQASEEERAELARLVDQYQDLLGEAPLRLFDRLPG